MAGIPQELIVDILSRLPVRSLLRFKSVCRSWYSMINDDDFIALHLERSRNHHFYLLQAIEQIPAPDNRVLLYDYPSPTYTLIEDPDPSKSYQRHIFALVQEDKLDEAFFVETPNPKISHIVSWSNGRRYLDVDMVGSINGLVCLAYNWGKCIVIWNPSMSQYYRVPDAKIPCKGSLNHSFGFAEHNNGHKVVRLLSDHAGGQHLSSKVRAEVFDLKTKSWTEIVNPPQVLFSQRTCGTILKGVPYWPMDYDVYASEKSDWIISFSASEDSFSMFKRPDFVIGEETFTWRVGSMVDDLVTFVEKKDLSVDVWKKMDEQVGENVGWEKVISIDRVLGIENWVGCWKNGEFLVSNDHEYAYDKEMFLYDVCSGESKIFPEIRSEGEERGSVEVCLYSESLIPPWYSG